MWEIYLLGIATIESDLFPPLVLPYRAWRYRPRAPGVPPDNPRSKNLFTTIKAHNTTSRVNSWIPSGLHAGSLVNGLKVRPGNERRSGQKEIHEQGENDPSHQ
jgi:hypothetical protein